MNFLVDLMSTFILVLFTSVLPITLFANSWLIADVIWAELVGLGVGFVVSKPITCTFVPWVTPDNTTVLIRWAEFRLNTRPVSGPVSHMVAGLSSMV